MGTGFSNWKDGVKKIRKHQESAHHVEAHYVLYVLPNQTEEIDMLLDIGHPSKQQANRQILLTILQNVKFLARQGLPLRGDGNEDNSNFMQLLMLRAEDNPGIHDWLKRKNDTYTSKEIQNEIIKLMAHACLRQICAELQAAKYYTIMADETTDAGNKEQLVIVFRCVDDELQIHEHFVGMYQVDRTDAQTIVAVLKDSLTALNLDIHCLRGQCYDGASTMSGAKSGVAKQILMEEPLAYYTHCYGHALNLAANDTIRNIPVLKNALDTTHELSKLIKRSPKRDATFRKLKAEIQPGSPGVRVLCPTRWTVRADALKSVLDNYSVLLELWQVAYDESRDTEIRARIQGIAAQMGTFEYYFASSLAEMILRHTDNLSKTLQQKDMSAAEGQGAVRDVRRTLESLREETHARSFWNSVTAKAIALELPEPRLQRKRKRPAHLEDGRAPPEFYHSPEQFYRVSAYNRAIDLIVTCLADRFEQPGYRMYSNLEQMVLKGCKREDYDDEFTFVSEHYSCDLDTANLRIQLQTLATNFPSHQDISLGNVVKYFQNLTNRRKSLYSEVIKLVKLILVMPASNATSERSFSALRRLKTYLRTTMSQCRLNNLMVLHVHRDIVDKMSLLQIGNEFISASDHRKSLFGLFSI